MKTLICAVLFVGGSSILSGHAADPKSTWMEKCAKCHGADGKGDTKMGRKLEIRDYTDAKVQAGFSDEAAARALRSGIKDKGGATRMRPIEGLSDTEVQALVAYLRSLKHDPHPQM